MQPAVLGPAFRISPGRIFVLALFALCPLLTLEASGVAPASVMHWEINGILSEACTCAVPCGCNFGSEPYPHHFCWSLMALYIQQGHYGNVNLDGLHLAGAHGKEGLVWYIDDRATPREAAALRAIAAKIASQRNEKTYFATAHLTQDIGSKGQTVRIGDLGGFQANYIVGNDGKNPIVVENMTAWNVKHDVKAETVELKYDDHYGNEFDFKNTNSNRAEFDWTDTTRNYF